MSEAKSRPCPLLAFNELVGGKYKLRILWILAEGVARYGAINRTLVLACQGRPVTPRVLSRELKDLAGRGLIHRTEFPGAPPRVEYQLTEAGKSLVPVLRTIFEWGRAGPGAVLIAGST